MRKLVTELQQSSSWVVIYWVTFKLISNVGDKIMVHVYSCIWNNNNYRQVVYLYFIMSTWDTFCKCWLCNQVGRCCRLLSRSWSSRCTPQWSSAPSDWPLKTSWRNSRPLSGMSLETWLIQVLQYQMFIHKTFVWNCPISFLNRTWMAVLVSGLVRVCSHYSCFDVLSI